jgi:hypothetical protein
MQWKTLAASALAFAMASATFAASNPFSDVPRTHWAYKAIQTAVDAGVLEGYDGKFHGEKLINRYQMAVIIKRILDNVGKAGGPAAAKMSGDDVKNLEAMMIEFADELALLNVKVSTLEDSFVELRGEVDRMKMGAGSKGMSAGGLSSAFTGFVSVGLISTDDGGSGVAPAGGFGGPIRTRYTASSADQTFFTIPQASIALDHEVGEGIGLHVQYDYETEGGSSAGGGTAGLAAGQGVGLNEAYLFVDEIFGDIGGKIGGFAMPFQSWEINGPFRSSNETITASAKNTFFEASRVVGLELTKTKDVDPADVKWHFGLFNGGDIAAPAGLASVAGVAAGGIGFMNDAAGLGALNRSATIDDSFGFYLDIESGDDPDKDWGWRIGFFDNGGDANAVPTVLVGAPPAGLANSLEIDGFQIGFWWKNDTFKVQFEYLSADAEANVAGVAFGNDADLDAWYLSVNFKMNDDTSLTLRYDDWENEVSVAPGLVAGGNITEGDAITFAWNKKINDTSMFQFEWLSTDEETNVGFGALGTNDIDDDLIQFRYKVWF